MPPPASDSKSMSESRAQDSVEERARAIMASIEEQKRLLEEQKMQAKEEAARVETETVPEQLPTADAQEQSQENSSAPGAKKDNVADNIRRVPDEHLPSHRERQRWDFSKRFSEIMDDMLPKLAVVTQKVNSYTGTDYSGVEALRREIKEQENLVKARRSAIDTAKHALDTAHAQQASAQKEVVALLERKHSWSAGDLERYMSLIRSEHVNDQAIRQAKESVIAAEAALEEARTQLEKRERAQYHEEQIWSDTIRRNSTWVTFGLMGVNIFLLLLSLTILEPWRRKRMVREIKSALEAQLEASKPALNATTASFAPTAASNSTQHQLSAIEEEIDRVTDDAESIAVEALPDSKDSIVEGSSSAPMGAILPMQAPAASTQTPISVVDPALGVASPSATIPHPQDTPAPQHASPDIPDSPRSKFESWQSKVTAVAQDVVSDRVISMRRIEYTSAILQGAAAGAIITASIIGMLRPN
ncbi:high expression sensitive protein 9 [Parastagonospora nodorum]|nr:high expression sensitive protein 9 [Parastagonospora nodorum]KAH6044051.1 high expression sensitive protein 9 [Parastagonospora nodorum]